MKAKGPAKDEEIKRLDKQINELKSQLATPTDALAQVQLYKTVADTEMARDHNGSPARGRRG